MRAAMQVPSPGNSAMSCRGYWIISYNDDTWVLVKIMVPFLGPYYNTAPII